MRLVSEKEPKMAMAHGTGRDGRDGGRGGLGTWHRQDLSLAERSQVTWDDLAFCCHIEWLTELLVF